MDPTREHAKNYDRDLFRSQFKKTQLCSFYREGRCRYSDSMCSFSHGDAEVAPDLTKTSLCQRWRQGTCPFSANTCRFAHGKHELRVTPLFTRRRRGYGAGEGDAVTAEPQSPTLRPPPVMATAATASYPRGPTVAKSGSVHIELDSILDQPESATSNGASQPWDVRELCDILEQEVANRFPCSTEPPSSLAAPQPNSLPLPSPSLLGGQSSGIAAAVCDPMKVWPSFSSSEVDGSSPKAAFAPQSFWEHWEGETVAGETNSDAGSSLSPTTSEAQDPPMTAHGYQTYSAFSGMPRVLF